jgi:predicted nucleic acid-binding protein
VAEGLILETSFLIDFERRSAQARAFLAGLNPAHLYITPTIAGELAAGHSLANRSRWQVFITRFRILPIDEDAEWHYGVTYRYLQANGLMIGANDLFIAAVALANQISVVTRNARHYGRVPGLEIVEYPR